MKIAQQAIHSDSSVVCIEIEDTPILQKASRANMANMEAHIVAAMVKEYGKRRDSDIAENPPFVVTPHHFQRNAICRALDLDPNSANNVNTVEKMQGQENDLVIACYGFTNPQLILSEMDFLYDRNRLNVAASRSKEKFVLVVSRALLRGVKELMESEKASEGVLLFSEIRKYALEKKSLFLHEFKQTFPPSSAQNSNAALETPRRQPRNRRKASTTKHSTSRKLQLKAAKLSSKSASSNDENPSSSAKRRLVLGARGASATVDDTGRCKGILRSGRRCRYRAKYGEFCGHHIPKD